MTCVRCAAELPAGARFCPACGAPAPAACVRCAAALAEGARFCVQCGHEVGGTAEPAAETAPPPDPVEAPVTRPVAERRITSVLFGDLVGFTALSEGRDPEDVRELLSQYFDTAREVVARYGGTIEKFIGDAVMAVWGVPATHEDDAERAVRAGLELTEAVAAFGASRGAPGLAMRVGVVTGEVAVTIGATDQGMVAGDAVNTAARVQGRADPGAVWVDAQTRSLAAASIDFVPAGMHELKGKAVALPLFAAASVRGGLGGDRPTDRVQAPLVGRRRELSVLKDLFHVVVDEGRPRVVVVTGDAGIGKSRLGRELRGYLDGLSARVRWHSGRCLAYGDGVAFSALTAAVRARIGAAAETDERTVRSRLAESLAAFVPDPDERAWLAPALAGLLGIGPSDAHATRDELFRAWLTWFERLHTLDGSPVVWVIDDAQHADAGLLDFVEHVLTVSGAPILVVLLTRHGLLGHRPGLAALRRASVLGLETLQRAEVVTLVGHLLDGLPADVREALVERAEGNPLYAIETVRALHDRGLAVEGPAGVDPAGADGSLRLADGVDAAQLLTLGAPASLHLLVSSRLDLLAPREREVLAVAAVLGQTFTTTALDALTGQPASLAASLTELSARDLITAVTDRRTSQAGRYTFAQSVVRHVAYQTQSRRDRLRRHLEAAAYLEPLADANGQLSAVITEHLRSALDATGDRDAAAADVLRRRLFAWLERSAARALSVGAPADATRGYLEALRTAGTPADAVRLRLAAAEAAGASGAHAEVIDILGELLAGIDPAADRQDIARAAALVSIASRRQGDYIAAWALLEPYAGTTSMDGLDVLVRSRLTREIGAYYAETGDLEQAWHWQERSVRIAEDTGDAREIVRSTNNFAITAGNRGHVRIAMTLFRVCAEVARAHHLLAEYALPLDNLVAYEMNRDLAAALASSRESLSVNESAGDSTACWHSAANRLLLLVAAGRWSERDAVLDRPLLRERAPEPDQEALTTLVQAVVADARDEPVDLEALARAASWVRELPESTGTSLYLANAALHARSVGDHAALVRAAQGCVATARRYCGLDDDFPHLWAWALGWLVDAGEWAAARTMLAMVSDAPATRYSPLLAGQLLRLRGSVDALAPAGAADERADPEGIERDLTDGIDALTAFGAVVDAARGQAVLGNWLARQGRPQDAAGYLTAARRTFEELGAVHWARELEPVGEGLPR